MNLYDLQSVGMDDAAFAAWLQGVDVGRGLPRLTAREAAALLADPEFFARPGQLWEPGAEQIDVFEGGRGSGKSYGGALAILAAARDPERWGGFALMAGPDPQAVDSDMLYGASGLLTIGRRMVEAGIGLPFIHNPSKLRVTFANPHGGGSGLTILLRASTKPRGGRGPSVGIAWLDEFGVWDHKTRDDQGTNFWQALRPAIRAGRPTSHVLITMTPSRQPEVRALQRDAERPECPTCRGRYLVERGPYDGEEGQEPWRLPRSPQVRLHPLLDTRTTEVLRECPACGEVVIAVVRTVFFATTDNPHTDAGSRERARRALASGRSSDRMEFAPTGEADSSPRGTLVLEQDIVRVDVDVAPSAPDRWQAALAALGIAASDTLALVDPAVTSKTTSDETGLGVAGGRWTSAQQRQHDAQHGKDADEAVQAQEKLVERVGRHGDSVATPLRIRQCVGLQDHSVRPGEVEAGPPSSVWAPRVYWLAVLWGCPRVVVEVNQGGDEVTAALRALVARPPAEQDREFLERLAREVGRPVGNLGALPRRVAQSARALHVETVTRRADKVVRWEWWGGSASRGEQALAALPWAGGARAWSVVVSQLTGLERPGASGGAPVQSARGDDRRDRADWLVGAAELILGVRETARGTVVQGPGWLGKVQAGALRR